VPIRAKISIAPNVLFGRKSVIFIGEYAFFVSPK
jgi:hypothetical protein